MKRLNYLKVFIRLLLAVIIGTLAVTSRMAALFFGGLMQLFERFAQFWLRLVEKI
jgi:hypothetical protein